MTVPEHREQRIEGRGTQNDRAVSHRGQELMPIMGEGKREDSFHLTEVMWLFVFGTTPFFAGFGVLLWYDPSAVVATVGFWFTAIPLAVAVPLAIIGPIYHRIRRDQT